MNEGVVIEQIKDLLPKVRSKYPKTSFEALCSELGELAEAIIDLENRKHTPEEYHRNRIKAEAIDVAIIAIRIANGEMY